MSGPGILIVGGGQAGSSVAVKLREEGYTGQVTIVGEEPYLPYQRPPLSKGFLFDEIDEIGIELRTAAFYEERGIEVVTDERVTDVQWQDIGGIAIAASGRRFTFARLVIATGADPRILSAPGADLAGVFTLRRMKDAQAVKRAWSRSKSVVVIGGGFIGLEVAAAAQAAGKDVTVVEYGERLMGRAISAATGEFFLRAHERSGIQFRMQGSVARVLGDGVVAGVELSGGEVIPADLVLTGIGALPRTELAQSLGLRIDRDAIVVDRYAQTSDTRVLAVGDVALQPHPLAGEGMVRLESVQNAVDHAKTAAFSILEAHVAHHSVPWFWSHQGDFKLQIAGLSGTATQTVIRENIEGERFCALYYEGDRLVAVDAVNCPADYMAVRRALTAGINIPAADAADPTVSLRSLLTAAEVIG